MPSKSTKKGFKAVSSTGKVKESLAYEDVEDEHTITPKATKSKSKTKITEAETMKRKSGDVATSQNGRKRRRSIAESEDDSEQPANITAKSTSAGKRKGPVSLPSSPSVSERAIMSQDSSPAAKKKKPSLEMASKKSAPSANASASASDSEENKLAAARDEGVKTYYPKITFDPQPLAQTLSGSAGQKGKNTKKRKSLSTEQPKSHKDKACALVSRVCSNELEGLQEYFSANHSSRDNVLRCLEAVLSQLPDAVQERLNESSDEVNFEPELSSREQTLLENRSQYLKKMTTEVEELQKCLENVSEMEAMFGASAAGVPVEPSVVPDVSFSSSSKQARDDYVDHLDKLNNYVNAIQKKLDEVNTDMTLARASQDDLYDACQKVRFNQQSGSVGASRVPPTPPSAPIFVSSRNFDTSGRSGGGATKTRAQQHATAKEAMKKLQRM